MCLASAIKGPQGRDGGGSGVVVIQAISKNIENL